MKSIANLAFLSAWISLASAFSLPESDGARIRTAETCGDPADAVPFYRSYASSDVDHWYTTDVQQINTFNPRGFALEGITGLVFVTQEAGTTPFYRLYSAAKTDNFYTISTTERDAALANGYVSDVNSNPVTYIYLTQICDSIPLFRLFSSSGQDNFYTTSESERLDFISNRGYADVEVAGYVLPLTPAQCA
ncbi:hypothetical protein C8R44DRAFT_728504 [Mycena epipterygia]|nr:hypothetical protein C8R44DRAFT_728504 [Mycena epipterygia]